MKKIEYFGANWCSSCNTVKSIIKSLNNIEVDYIDVEKHTDRALKLGIKSIPVVRVLNENNEEENRFIGNFSKDQLISSLN